MIIPSCKYSYDFERVTDLLSNLDFEIVDRMNPSKAAAYLNDICNANFPTGMFFIHEKDGARTIVDGRKRLQLLASVLSDREDFIVEMHFIPISGKFTANWTKERYSLDARSIGNTFEAINKINLISENENISKKDKATMVCNIRRANAFFQNLSVPVCRILDGDAGMIRTVINRSI